MNAAAPATVSAIMKGCTLTSSEAAIDTAIGATTSTVATLEMNCPSTSVTTQNVGELGAAPNAGNTGTVTFATALTVNAVPEPATLGLLAAVPAKAARLLGWRPTRAWRTELAAASAAATAAASIS